jgi:predicted CXXCH cytochrome family protein
VRATLKTLCRIVFWGFALRLGFFAAENGYVGRDVCKSCHPSIAASQAKTRMARTWQGTATKLLPPNYSGRRAEGADPALNYAVTRNTKGFRFELRMPGDSSLQFPIETTVGGDRHGLSFLFRVPDIAGIPLPRAPLVEARYLHSVTRHGLALSPGFPKDKPATLETALGRALPWHFEKKCLACHGEPTADGSHRNAGVSCEDCHGPGKPHLAALGRQSDDKGIVNPKKLPIAEQMRPCSACHAGFSNVEDPTPDDLLISDQVTALSQTECWRQSAGRITCVSCHDAHQDSPRAALVQKSEKTCLMCHSGVANHAGLCPVNRANGCVGCHMPDENDRPPFVIADHWIRVHGAGTATKGQNAWRSQVTPRRLYLRMIEFADRARADEVRRQLTRGGSFFELARANSIDQDTAPGGGFLGDLEAARLNPVWSAAALRLEPGELSDVIEGQDKYFILQRLPRTFRDDAATHFQKAMELRQAGDRRQSAAELMEALKIYPYFLRALTYLGITYGEAGNPKAGVGVLNLASTLYPRDAGAHFNLAIAYGAQGNENEIAEYRRALELDPDLAPAYLNWGAALYAKGRRGEAIAVYRRGIGMNPLVAGLHYSLSIALDQEGKKQEAEAEMTLARKIDPHL